MRELDPLGLVRAGRTGGPGAHRHAEDHRPAARRSSRAALRRLAAAREEPPVPDGRRRARPARAPHERGTPSLPLSGDEGAKVADVPTPLRECRRARAHRGRPEEACGRLARDARPARDRPRAPRAGRARSRPGGAHGNAPARAPPAPPATARSTSPRRDWPRACERDTARVHGSRPSRHRRSSRRTRSNTSRRRCTRT